MISEDFLVKELQQISKILGITLKGRVKKDKVDFLLKETVNISNIDEIVYSVVGDKYSSTKKKTSSRKTTRSSPVKKSKIDVSIAQSINKINERLNLVDDQIKFIMSKISNLEVKIEKTHNPIALDSSDKSKIKTIIINGVKPGKSVTIDRIKEVSQLKNYSWDVIKDVLLALIDEEIFDGSEGKSHIKLPGNVGRLIRR